jgi:hypothetical protein
MMRTWGLKYFHSLVVDDAAQLNKITFISLVLRSSNYRVIIKTQDTGLFFEFELLHRQNSPYWVDLQSWARPISALLQHHLFLLIQDYLRNVTISSADKF